MTCYRINSSKHWQFSNYEKSNENTTCKRMIIILAQAVFLCLKRGQNNFGSKFLTQKNEEESIMPKKKTAATPDDANTNVVDQIDHMEEAKNEDADQNPEEAVNIGSEDIAVDDDLLDSSVTADDTLPNSSVTVDADTKQSTLAEPDVVLSGISGRASAEVLDEADFTGINDSSELSEPDRASNSNPSQSAPAPRQRKRTQSELPAPVLTLEVGGEVVTQEEKDNTIWHEIKNSQVTGTHLTGILGKVEQLESGSLIAVVDYKGQRIAIPLKEMMLGLNRPKGQSDYDYNERESRILNRMMGAEIDFVIRGITGAGEERAAVASRKAAMLRLRRRYYLSNSSNGKPMVYPGRIVEARIIAVSQMSVRVEIFGVETSIRNWELSWGYMGDARDGYFVGDSVQVYVKNVSGDTPETLRVKADIRSLTVDDTHEKLMALKPQTNCMGKVTAVRDGVIYISLVDGIKAIAHKSYDRRKPGKGDDVLFVVTRVDEEGRVALGIVARIVKRNI
jgi:exosome complex RNA-binding protein Csl4